MAKVVPCGMEVEDKGCAPDEGCLTVEHVHLSPTLAAQTITYDFHALQPLLAILPSLVAEWAEIEFGKVVGEFERVVGALERAWMTRKANAKNDLHNHDLHTS